MATTHRTLCGDGAKAGAGAGLWIGRIGAIQRVVHDGVAQRLQMHTDLVRAPRDRHAVHLPTSDLACDRAMQRRAAHSQSSGAAGAQIDLAAYDAAAADARQPQEPRGCRLSLHRSGLLLTRPRPRLRVCCVGHVGRSCLRVDGERPARRPVGSQHAQRSSRGLSKTTRFKAQPQHHGSHDDIIQ